MGDWKREDGNIEFKITGPNGGSGKPYSDAVFELYLHLTQINLVLSNVRMTVKEAADECDRIFKKHYDTQISPGFIELQALEAKLRALL